MKKQIIISIILFSIIAGSTFANVMPFGITISTTGGNLEIVYRLNETCSAVTVQIYGPLPSTTIVQSLPGTTNFGANTVTWAWANGGLLPTGTFGVKVHAVDNVGHSSWDLLTNDANTTLHFEYPRGVAVNKNNGSPYFGMIYLANGRNGTTYGGKPCYDGVYGFYPDLSDPIGALNTTRTGNVNWGLSANSPYHLFVGPDDKLWIADWSDAHSGVWRAEADLSGSWVEILDNTGRTPSGLVPNIHGSVAGVWVEGTGTNTVLYTQDEDYPDNTEPRARSIWKYNIGNGPFPWTGAPTVVIDDANFTTPPGTSGGILINDAPGTIRRDSAGRWYVANYRSAGTDCPSIVVFSPNGQSIYWDSISTGNGGTTPDPLRDCRGGFILDEAHNRLIVGASTNIDTGGFVVVPLPLPVGNLSSVTTIVKWNGPYGTAAPRGPDCDAAGNIYLACNINEVLRIYSPPDGPNSFTTVAGYTIDNGVVFAVTPVSPITISVGQNKQFTASGGKPPYTWSLSTTGVGSLDTTEGAVVTFTAIAGGSVDLTVADSRTPTPQQIIISITVLPTGAPLFNERELRKDNIRFELLD
ncbi:MAG: hypothetical protein N3A72_06530 [bacterium]|nr:hypothetical protein [bacterium]